MLAPRGVNQVAQNRGIEGYMRELGKRARADGGDVHVKATATSWGNPTPRGWVPPRGADFLQRAEYQITLDLPGRAKQEIRVTIHVDEPPSTGWWAEVEPDYAFDLNELF
jgi:HSP20 family molecular chaperone IbpA